MKLIEELNQWKGPTDLFAVKHIAPDESWVIDLEAFT